MKSTEIFWGILTKRFFRKKEKRTMLFWLVSTFLLCLGFLAMSAWYLGYVRTTIRQDAKGNLAEMGKHIAKNLQTEIHNTSAVLGSLSLEVGLNKFSTNDLIIFLKEQSSYWNFYDLAAIDSNGISVHQDGSRDTPTNRELLSEALRTGKITYDFLMINDEDCVVFFSALPQQMREESGFLAVTGTYAVRNWELLMNIDIFGGHAITQILTKDGVVVTRNHESDDTYYNYFDAIANAEFEDGVTLAQVRQNLWNEQEQYLSYHLDDIEYYLNCAPIGFNGWSLVFTVPATIVNYAGEQMAHSILLISAGLSLIFFVILVLFWIFQSQAQRRVWSAAYVDTVTGGANKNKFELDALALLERPGRVYTLVYSNIEQFKLLNQRFGKDEADYILKSLYTAFQHSITDRECCARLTSDHFVLLLEGENQEKRLEELAQREALQTTMGGLPCSIRLVFGLCPVEPETRELTTVIDRANMAIAMSQPGSRLSIYNDAMMEQAARERELTECLQKEEIKKEIFILLQPKIDLLTGQVVGAEALARWNSPDFGFVSPGEFIPLAEKSGMICQIDWYVFELVCQTLTRWQQVGRELLPISFNLSKAQLAFPGFLDHYWDIIQHYGAPCEFLDFEFTESLLYENSGVLQKAVEKIHLMGAKCSVDDFGYGYSSLGLLGQYEADTLKLDRSFFLEDAEPDSRNNRIVKSVIQIADSLGMKTVAEGIEDFEHVEMLRAFGCGSIQGFYYSKPLPLEEFQQFVDRRRDRGRNI